jgi:hypothetical protein
LRFANIQVIRACRSISEREGLESLLNQAEPAVRTGTEDWLFVTFGADEVMRSRGTEPGTEEIEVGTAVHLPLQQLQFGNLSLGLAVGPRLGDGRGHGVAIGRNSFGEGGEQADRRVSEPHVEGGALLRPKHALEAIDQDRRFAQRGHGVFHYGDKPGVGV